MAEEYRLMIVDTNPAAARSGRNIRARGPSHGRVWAACLLAGAALPLAAMAWAATLLHAERVGGPAVAQRPSARSSTWHTAVRTVAAAQPPVTVAGVRALPAPAPAPAPTASARHAAVPGTVAAAAPASRPPSTEAGPADAVDGDAGTAPRFFLYREVDTAAEPVSTWNIDAVDLDALATSRLVFTLFVGSDGSVLYCSVDEPERLAPETRHRLAQRLRETAMRPARRAGLAVPSRRRVELYTDSGA